MESFEYLGLPGAVRIGYFTARIVPWDSHRAAGAERLAEFAPLEQEIRISRMLVSRLMVAEVLIHEVLHACMYVWGIKPESEERLVNPLASALLTVWCDNPELVDWITNAARENRR